MPLMHKVEEMSITTFLLDPHWQLYMWSDLWAPQFVSTKSFVDLNDVTLADEDTNAIAADEVNIGRGRQ